MAKLLKLAVNYSCYHMAHAEPVYYVSDCSSKDLEQFAAGSDVITITPIF